MAPCTWPCVVPGASNDVTSLQAQAASPSGPKMLWACALHQVKTPKDRLPLQHSLCEVEREEEGNPFSFCSTSFPGVYLTLCSVHSWEVGRAIFSLPLHWGNN